MKAIANRIKTVFPNLITNYQTGFMKNRYIGENIRTTIDIIEQLNVNNQPGLIIFTDFEKAFDSLDHDNIFIVFEKCNFDEHMINWIKLTIIYLV